MRTFGFSRYAVGFCAAAAILCGCGGSQLPIGVSQNGAQSLPSMKRGTPGGDLLYVSDYSTFDVYALSYPSGNLVLTLKGFGAPQGLCSDKSGDVFVTDAKAATIIEYAHGGTTPIKTLNGLGRPSACWVDPTTGNLAVANLNSFVSIYKNASGSPSNYSTQTSAIFCAYDESGNLYVDEPGQLSTGNQVEVLPKGGNSFETMNLNKGLGNSWPGGVQWHGQHLIVAKEGSYYGRIYRFIVKGTNGYHAGSFRTDTGIADFLIYGSTLIATTLDGEIEYYDWTHWQGPIKKFSSPGRYPFGVTISPASSR